jgi:hypoxanthine phosphoribosyltransferase
VALNNLKEVARALKKLRSTETLLYYTKKGVVHLNTTIVRSLSPTKCIFVTMKQLFEWTTELADTLPNSFDVVVGCPRSGTLIASIVALKYGAPLSTPDLLSKGFVWAPRHLSHINNCRPESLQVIGNIKNVLLLDDCIGTGETFAKALKQIKTRFPLVNVFRAVITAKKRQKHLVDYCQVVIPNIEFIINEWQLATTPNNVAVDFDGVLCKESSEDPLFVPKYVVAAIITGRSESRRIETESWLNRHNVRYKQLIMSCDIEGKIRNLRKIRPKFFIESDLGSAREIWKQTNIPVLCYSKKVVFS